MEALSILLFMFFKNSEDGGGGKKCLKTCIAVATG